jgi:hypothetical protein
MFREGIHDTLHLPEVHSEAEEATHALLGCTHHIAMLMLGNTCVSDPDDPTPPEVLRMLEALLEMQLDARAAQVVLTRRPLGPMLCGREG